MDEPFRQFEWQVFPAYHWQDWLNKRGRPVVVPRRGMLGLHSTAAVEQTWQHFHKKKLQTGPVLGPVIDGANTRTYSPMSREHATLFRTFADLDYTERDAIRSFASKYGLLGLSPQEQNMPVPGRSGASRYRYVSGESHLDWAREICLMREALELSRFRTPTQDAERRADWNRVGLEPPDDEDRNRLTWLLNLHLQKVQARMLLEKDVAPRLSFAPLTLLAAMWLQLALSVVGDKDFRSCKHCHNLFEISTDDTGYRRHREFCSESCKTKDYRKRKRTALKLAADGKPAAIIAKATATNVITVRAWIAASHEQREG
jgi:hypothetical protein